MPEERFREILAGARNGGEKEMEQIYEIYMPVIKKNSIIAGKMDEDLKQYLMLHIWIRIKQFPL